MPFELQNTPGTFSKKVVVKCLAGKFQFALSSLDDIVMFSRRLKENIDNVGHVLTLFHDAGDTVKLKKGKFFTGIINYLGHTIRIKPLKIASHTANAIRGLKQAASLSKCKFFAGLWIVFRRFNL